MVGRAGWVTAAVAATATGVAALVIGGPVLAPSASTAQADELRPFEGCGQLRQWYARTALDEVTAWGLGTAAGPMPIVDAMPLAAAEAGTAVRADSTDAATGAGETGTNVQEAGVDEPDVAKTDGERVVLLDGGQLVVVDVTGDQPQEIGRLALPPGTDARQLLLVDDRAVLLSAEQGSTVPIGTFDSYSPVPLTSTVTTVDLADPTAPRLVRTEQIAGSLVSAREHDGTVRIAISSTPDLPFVTPVDGLSHRDALAANREVVRDARPRDWLPARTTTGGDLDAGINGSDVTRLIPCAEVRHPEQAAGLGTLSILSIDPQAPEEHTATGLTTDGSMLYASTDRLYVATTQGGWDSMFRGWDGDEQVTAVHAFDTTGSTTAYVASGEVPGAAPDRWAFSEHEGRLRVATTLGDPWSPQASQVTVLEESDGDLAEVGSVGGLGRGETIHAVRWFGDVAVLVTFQQVDPLYTLDLSDPAAPRLAGELKIPGFSEYLHPLGADLLLGVGQDATARGVTTGLQASTFDVGDLAAPRRLATLDLRADTSPVENDSRAFGYLPEQRLALISTSSWTGGGAGLALVRVGTDGSLTTVGRLTRLSGPAAQVRALPLADGRVAVTAGGGVSDLLMPAAG